METGRPLRDERFPGDPVRTSLDARLRRSAHDPLHLSAGGGDRRGSGGRTGPLERGPPVLPGPGRRCAFAARAHARRSGASTGCGVSTRATAGRTLSRPPRPTIVQAGEGGPRVKAGLLHDSERKPEAAMLDTHVLDRAAVAIRSPADRPPEGVA